MNTIVHKKTLTARILNLEYLIGIFEEIESFDEQVKVLLDEIENSGQDYHFDFLMSLCRRQTAYLKRNNITC